MSKSSATRSIRWMTAKYGADAFRLGTMRQMRLESQELRFDERVCDEARAFNTKLWNALRYISALTEGLPSRRGCRRRVAVAGRQMDPDRVALLRQRTHPGVRPFAFGTAAERCTISAGTSSATGTWKRRKSMRRKARAPRCFLYVSTRWHACCIRSHRL